MSRDLPARSTATASSIRSTYTERHGDSLNFTFTGKLTGDEMAGALDMGEYLTAAGRPSGARSARMRPHETARRMSPRGCAC